MSNILYNLLRTPLAIGLLYLYSNLVMIGQLVSKSHPGKLVAMSVIIYLVVLWVSRWLITNFLSMVRLPISSEQNLNQVPGHSLLVLIAEPVIRVTRFPHIDEKAFER